MAPKQDSIVPTADILVVDDSIASEKEKLIPEANILWIATWGSGLYLFGRKRRQQ